MTKAEILALAKTISRQPDLDDDTIDIYYDDVIDEIGQTSIPPLVAIELFAITSGTVEYTYDTSAVKLLAVFAGTRQLLPASTMDMEAYNDEWRTLSGTPIAFNEGERTAREFALVPIPDASSDPLLGPEPFGDDYPDDTGVQLYSVTRDVEIPDWIALFVCIRILAKDFARPSVYQDTVFSEFCFKLSEILWKAAGL